MSDVLTDKDIENIISGLAPVQTNSINSDLAYICPTCKTSTKRIRVSNPKRENRKTYNDSQGNLVNPIPMDLHLRIINDRNITEHNYVLKTGFTICLACKTTWYQ